MKSTRDKNKYSAKECLDKIRETMNYESSTYEEYFKPSLLQRGKDYFDIFKRPALNYKVEYKDYYKILDSKKLDENQKLAQLIETAKKTYADMESKTKSKWKYGGYMHRAIANLTPSSDGVNTTSLNEVIKHIQQELKNAKIALDKPQDTHRRESAPARVEGNIEKEQSPNRRGSAPGILSKNTHSTIYSRPKQEQRKESCMDVLRDIFQLASMRADITDKVKNEYISCNYAGILNNDRMSDTEKEKALFDAARQVLYGRMKGELHQVVLDIDKDNPIYLHSLKQIKHKYEVAVEKQNQQVHDNRRNTNP